MNAGPVNGHEKGEEHAGNSSTSIPSSTIYSYNLDDSKTPGGIKVRWNDARQAEAILEALRWTARHQRQLRAAQAAR
jgi:hypothetical protein